MSKSNSKKLQEQEIVKDEAYWLNEIEYFEDAREGLKMSYAIVSAMIAKANEEYEKIKGK